MEIFSLLILFLPPVQCRTVLALDAHREKWWGVHKLSQMVLLLISPLSLSCDEVKNMYFSTVVPKVEERGVAQRLYFNCVFTRDNRSQLCLLMYADVLSYTLGFIH